MSNTDLDAAWTVLATEPPEFGVTVSPTGTDLAAGELLLGIDHEGRRHFLVPLIPGEAARTDKRGRGVQLARFTHEGTHYLTVFCLLPELHSVFTQFCRELIDSIAQAASPAKEVAAALDRWRALFSDAAREGQLSDEKLTGLLGELLIVDDLLRHGAPGDLQYWGGPFGDVHDFRSHSHAIEVKATLAREGRVVPISSIDQLLEPPNGTLALAHMRLNPDPSGFNLGDLVTRVLGSGAHSTQLARRLFELGVSSDRLEPYSQRKFRVVDTRIYDVASEAFPRLVRSSFAAGDVPAGILRIGYAIDLTNEPPIPLKDEQVDGVLTSLATEASDEVDS